MKFLFRDLTRLVLVFRQLFPLVVVPSGANRIPIALAVTMLVSMAPATADTQSREPISVPPIDLSNDAPGLTAPPVVPTTEPEQKVLDYLEKGETAEVQKLITATIAQSKGVDCELSNLRAYLDFQAGDYNKAVQDLRESLSLKGAGASGTDAYRAFQIKCLGDTYYHMQRKKEALQQYQDALALIKGSNELDVLRVSILEPLTNCLVENGELKEAQTRGEQLISCCQRLASDGQLVNLGPLFWSQIELLGIYKEQGEKEKFQQLYGAFTSLLERLMSLRNQLTAPLTLPEKVAFPARLRHALLSQYIAQNKPKTLSQYLWLTSAFRMRSLPLIAWEPKGKPVAAILCVHALGLENRAFEPFAAEMTARNFVVYAMDVRGFGAWQSEFGNQTVNFDRTLTDIHTVINFIKERSPDLPVFLLGESMGGALVLRAGADYGGDLKGVISSVPSAERYGDTKMSIRVATHFLRHKNRPISIGTIANQATADEEMRKLWEMDPKAKEKLSPVELIRFNNFMNSTKQQCSLIKTTPVLVVQGLADRLVKPQGTYEMFDAINSPDKAMLILGNAEHLIFETPHQSLVLLDGLTAWLKDHSAGTKASSTPAN